jgi:transcriptional regulator with XRE-family HTH domain
MEGLPGKIREARERAGMRREDVAYHLQVAHASVGRWETGKSTPSLKTLSRIADLTGQPLTFFLALNGDDA